MKTLPVTLVIPHRNRVEELRHCLQSLQVAKAIPEKVIVVDDFSCAEQQKLVSDILSEFNNLNIKLFFYGENVGTSDAKNLGILKTQTPYIWFLDSDTQIINPNALEIGCEVLRKNPSIGVVGAEFLEDDKHQRYVRESCLLRSLWTACINHPVGNEIRKEVDIMPTCNFLTRTDLIKEIGGFHSKLVNGEDKLACLQIRELGYSIFLDSRFEVLHCLSPVERGKFLTRVRITFRDVAFIYGATSSFLSLVVFHLNCLLSLKKLYSNNIETYRLFYHNKDRFNAAPTKGLSELGKQLMDLGKLACQYVLANKTYMSFKGYCFRLLTKNKPNKFQEQTINLTKKLTHEL